MTLSAPQLLIAAHDVSEFDCGHPTLDYWLRQHALLNQERRASRTYVVLKERTVKAYYSMAAGSIAHEHATGRIRRNMPDPVPVALLGRLAVDRSIQGRGYGLGLLKDALSRVVLAADLLAVRGVLVDAIDDEAKRFYVKFGFVASPTLSLRLMITLEQAELAMREAR